jgi:hypothetical protein
MMDDQAGYVPVPPTSGPNVPMLASPAAATRWAAAEPFDRSADLDHDPVWLRLDRDSWRQIAREAVIAQHRTELDWETERRRDLAYARQLVAVLEAARTLVTHYGSDPASSVAHRNGLWSALMAAVAAAPDPGMVR